jgi:predicted dehydrogenase
MGPYYVSTLIHVFGPVAAVAALGLKGSETRAVQVGPLAGEEFPVEIPSTVSVLMQFEQGGQAQSLYSTDSPLHRQGVVEITGTEGTMVIPDPNTFGGAITITRPLSEAVVPPVPVVQETVDVPQEGVLVGRGLGLLDMARSIRAGRPHIATGRFGYHVLDTLLSVEEAVESRQFVEVTSTVDEVGSLAADFDPLAATL